jgi:predicted nucleic acid-binding protein
MIALAEVREEHHARVKEIEKRAHPAFHPWVTTNLFLAELHAFFLRRHGRSAADAATLRVTGSPRVEIAFPGPDLHRAGLALLARYADLRLSYADAIGLALAQERGIDDAFTLDQVWSACGVTPIS